MKKGITILFLLTTVRNSSTAQDHAWRDSILHKLTIASRIAKKNIAQATSILQNINDINALQDEYLRLAYQGVRAKDKSFQATTITQFDNRIGKINIVPQDVGRAILNLINNALYAVHEKQKRKAPGYEPTVTLSTESRTEKLKLK